jgi:SAM-dependent methyltransferase
LQHGGGSILNARIGFAATSAVVNCLFPLLTAPVCRAWLRVVEVAPLRELKLHALKTSIRAAIHRLGFDVVRRPDPFLAAIYEALGPETLSRKPFINIGAGSFWHPYWTNVDYASDWYGSVQRDVIHYDIMGSEPLPFANDSLKIAYTSHTIEHVKEDAVARLFREVHRTLEPGGIFRVTTGPDAETDFRALMRGDESWFYWDHYYVAKGNYEHLFHAPATSVPLAERWLNHVASELAPNNKTAAPIKYAAPEILRIIEEKGFEGSLDFFTSQCQFRADRPGNHVSWWTHGKVIDFLRQAGFETVYRSGYRQSASPLMRGSDLFDSTHPQMSIYVEAIKAG